MAPSHRYNEPPAYRRFLSMWSRTINTFAAMTGRRGRRRQEVVTAAWITSAVVGIVVVAALLEATHGLVLLLLVVLGIFAWRRHEATKQEGDARQRAAQAAAAHEQAMKEAAERQRADSAAAAQRERAAKEAAARQRAAEAERARTAREAQQAAAKQEAARAAAQSGDLEFILGLSPTQFEYTMAAMLKMLGMTDVKRVGGRGDLGVDITARDPAGRTMVVQCKRYARAKKIGSPDIQRFIGMAYVHHQADLKLFVTTSDFTDEAQALARRHEIQLMNGSDIEELARRQRESNH